MKETIEVEKCKGKTEVYSRVSGFYRPVTQWNKGKREEFAERKVYTALDPHE